MSDDAVEVETVITDKGVWAVETADAFAGELLRESDVSKWKNKVLGLIISAMERERQDPVGVMMFCPRCGEQHVDRADPHTGGCPLAPDRRVRREAVRMERRSYQTATEVASPAEPECSCGCWTNPPHRSHLCHHCGWVWRPSDRSTEGIASCVTGGGRDRVPVICGRVAQTPTRLGHEQTLLAAPSTSHVDRQVKPGGGDGWA